MWLPRQLTNWSLSEWWQGCLATSFHTYLLHFLPLHTYRFSVQGYPLGTRGIFLPAHIKPELIKQSGWSMTCFNPFPPPACPSWTKKPDLSHRHSHILHRDRAASSPPPMHQHHHLCVKMATQKAVITNKPRKVTCKYQHSSTHQWSKLEDCGLQTSGNHVSHSSPHTSWLKAPQLCSAWNTKCWHECRHILMWARHQKGKIRLSVKQTNLQWMNTTDWTPYCQCKFQGAICLLGKSWANSSVYANLCYENTLQHCSKFGCYQSPH